MATAYTLAANATLRDIGNAGIWGVATARTGSDTMTTNGFTFTQDQDSRYGLGGNTSAIWGALTVHATKGGNINFDGRYIRLIPYTSGSGTLTAGATIAAGSSATGKAIGLYSNFTSAPVLTGVATGWLKVTAWNGTAYPTSGTFTEGGFTYTISGASIVGFMEVNAIEHATANTSSIFANRLGQVNITGEWFSLGTTDATTTKTFQLPTHGLLRHSAGVFVEQTAGQKDYEFYPNAGTATTVGTEATRGKVCWITNAGVCRIGDNGSGTMGHHPGANKEVVVGNIWFENVAPATYTANVIPNATILTRYHFNSSGGGVVNVDKCDMAWYLIISQAYSCTLTNCGFIDAINVSEVATPMTWSKVGVGNKPTTALAIAPLTLATCFSGGTITDCVWNKVTLAASGIVSLTDIAGFTFVRNTIRATTITGANLMMSVIATRAVNCTWENPTVIQGALNFITCNGITVTDTIYVNACSGTTVTTYTNYIYNISANTLNCTFSGLTLPVANTNPYSAVLIAATGCAYVKLRNIGTRSSPLNIGHTTTANSTGLLYAISGGCTDFKFQRIYVSNTRTGLMTGDNSCLRITEENVWGDYADAADVMVCLQHVRNGMGGTGAVTAQTGVYGTHWRDGFTSTTAGRIAILMNEPNAVTAGYITLTGGAGFTATGICSMPTVGMTATFEMPYYCIGHTRINTTTPVMGNGTIGNFTFDYAIDLNDGNGFSTMTTSAYTAANLATALNGITTIDASKGFKLKIKITTGTANTAGPSSLYLTTISTTTAQDYQYALDSNTVTFTGLPTGCDAVTLTAGTTTILDSKDSMAGTTYSYTYSGTQSVDVGFIKPGYIPFYIRNLSLTTTDASIPVSLTLDRNYVA